MDLHNPPTNVDLIDPPASMTPPMLPDAAEPPNFTWNIALEGLVSEEHVAKVLDNVEETRVAPHELALSEQPTQDDVLLPPLNDHVQSLYDAYQTSYAFPICETSAHMQHAKDLGFVLLQRHYPKSQGYLVEAVSLGPYCTKGVNFILKESNEPDSDPDTPAKKQKQKQKQIARKTNTHYSYSAPWHYIAPENMAAFVVKKAVSEGPGDVELMTYRTHTCFVILLDDLSTFYRYSRDNVNHRGDVLSDLLGVVGGIEKGHGMLFFGPRLELYSYNACNQSQPVSPDQSKAWKMDMRTVKLAEVDDALHSFARQEVVYKDEL